MDTQEKALAGASHLGIFFNLIGFIAVIVIYLSQKNKSRFVSDHAKQALGFQMAIFAASMLLGILMMLGFAGGGMMFHSGNWGIFHAGSLGGVAFLMSLVHFAIWVYAVIAALHGFTGRSFKYAIIGDKVAQLDR